MQAELLLEGREEVPEDTLIGIRQALHRIPHSHHLQRYMAPVVATVKVVRPIMPVVVAVLMELVAQDHLAQQVRAELDLGLHLYRV